MSHEKCSQKFSAALEPDRIGSDSNCSILGRARQRLMAALSRSGSNYQLGLLTRAEGGFNILPKAGKA